jgi:hypothetical protein
MAAAPASPTTSTPRPAPPASGPTPSSQDHAHLYQRFTRKVDGRQIPYVVAGSGGFPATRPVGGLPNAPFTIGEYTVVKQPIIEFGYLTVSVDMTKKTSYLTIIFRGCGKELASKPPRRALIADRHRTSMDGVRQVSGSPGGERSLLVEVLNKRTCRGCAGQAARSAEVRAAIVTLRSGSRVES